VLVIDDVVGIVGARALVAEGTEHLAGSSARGGAVGAVGLRAARSKIGVDVVCGTASSCRWDARIAAGSIVSVRGSTW
jgi:hypothetical protein